MVRLLVSLAAIGITTFLVSEERNRRQRCCASRRGSSNLTHDAIFVRDMNDVITYWNRGAEALYGWPSDEAIGKVTHELLQTDFPAPFEEITAELLRTDRWEGELVTPSSDGSGRRREPLGAAARRPRGAPWRSSRPITTSRTASGRRSKAPRGREGASATIDTIPAMVMAAPPMAAPEFVNKRWLDYTGLSPSEAHCWRIGRSTIHPDDLPGFAESAERDRWHPASLTRPKRDCGASTASIAGS